MLDLVAAIVVTAVAGADPYTIGKGDARSDFLATPAPYPAGRTDSPIRLENGRLWVSRFPIGSRTPIAEQVYASPGAASYGAAPSENHTIAYTRVGHLVIAFDPFATHRQQGSVGAGGRDFTRASNLWLREQGYVLKVRTHVNARYLHEAAQRNADGPLPRATIRINREQEQPKNMQALAPSWNPIAYETWQQQQADATAAEEEAGPEMDANEAVTEHALADDGE